MSCFIQKYLPARKICKNSVYPINIPQSSHYTCVSLRLPISTLRNVVVGGESVTVTQYGFPLDEENAELFPLSGDSDIVVTTVADSGVGCDSVQKWCQATISAIPSAHNDDPATRGAMSE